MFSISHQTAVMESCGFVSIMTVNKIMLYSYLREEKKNMEFFCMSLKVTLQWLCFISKFSDFNGFKTEVFNTGITCLWIFLRDSWSSCLIFVLSYILPIKWKSNTSVFHMDLMKTKQLNAFEGCYSERCCYGRKV